MYVWSKFPENLKEIDLHAFGRHERQKTLAELSEKEEDKKENREVVYPINFSPSPMFFW